MGSISDYPAADIVAFVTAAAQKKTVYMWGTLGNTLTKSLIADKRKQYGDGKYNDDRVAYLKSLLGKGYLACDCCGLAKWFLMSDGGRLAAPKYIKALDLTASGFKDAAQKKGTMDTMPEMPGLGLWRSGHMGIYIGGGKCVECTLSSRGDGVVISDIKKCNWTHWFELIHITYPRQAPAPRPTAVASCVGAAQTMPPYTPAPPSAAPSPSSAPSPASAAQVSGSSVSASSSPLWEEIKKAVAKLHFIKL